MGLGCGGAGERDKERHVLSQGLQAQGVAGLVSKVLTTVTRYTPCGSSLRKRPPIQATVSLSLLTCNQNLHLAIICCYASSCCHLSGRWPSLNYIAGLKGNPFFFSTVILLTSHL